MDSSEGLRSRRSFLTTGLSVTTLAAGPQGTAAQASAPSAMFDVDYGKLVAPGDLHYEKPVPRAEEGIPVGNGRMGSLVSTTGSAIRMQINRVDAYANDSTTNSFFERHNDYCGGCAFVDLDFGGAREDPFPAAGFSQRLAIYDALLTINGKDVTARILAWPSQDVMAVAVEDRRPAPEAVHVNLRMLRYETKYFGSQLETFARDHIATVQTRSHTAASQLHIRGNRIVLTQDFRENQFCCKTAVAIGMTGRAAKPRLTNETEVCLATAPARGSFTILIASAATFDPNEDIVASALSELDAAASRGFPALARETQDWWHTFWSRGFVHLSSPDGEAGFVEQHYHYFLYWFVRGISG